MGTLNLSLVEADNPIWFALIRKANDLTSRFNTANRHLFAINTRLWHIRKSRQMLKAILPEVQDFDKDALAWRGEATNFVLNPVLVPPRNEGRELVFLHYVESVRDAVRRAELQMETLERNYNNIFSQVDGQVNFSIAIGSFILAILGLIVAIVPIFLSN